MAQMTRMVPLLGRRSSQRSLGLRPALVRLLLALLLACAAAPGAQAQRRRLQQSFLLFVGRPRFQQWWRDFHNVLKTEVDDAEDSPQKFEVVFYGDSLTEALRGTRDAGTQAVPDVAEVFQRHVGDRYHARPLGIGGDTTFNLMWRMRHGELPLRRRPRLAVILIGTNDVRIAGATRKTLRQDANSTLERVTMIVQYVKRTLPRTQVALIALLPRGSPGTAKPYQQSFPRAWDLMNRGYRDLAERSNRVHYIGCGGQLLLAGGASAAGAGKRKLARTLYEDYTHPNAAGYELLFSQCWDAAIARIMGGEKKVIMTEPLPAPSPAPQASTQAVASPLPAAAAAGVTKDRVGTAAGVRYPTYPDGSRPGVQGQRGAAAARAGAYAP